jgi:hypothetical protein
MCHELGLCLLAEKTVDEIKLLTRTNNSLVIMFSSNEWVQVLNLRPIT